jgi:hypothetical protein
MLFGYPIEATAENWLHDCLFEILQTIHVSMRSNQAPPDWPEIIPETQRESLRNRRGLRDRLADYQLAITNLGSDELNQVIRALSEQNEIELLLSGACNCEPVDNLPASVRQPIIDLFKFGFELLKELGVRDRQYNAIYDSTPIHICPFCGCEYFDAPGAPREALDHYLAESKYPFAAANLRNLVPMGNKCNSRYKLAQDILLEEDGTRRRSFYPYRNHAGIQITLDRSEPFLGTQGLFPFPLWHIDFEPNCEEVLTWDTVFHIRERYARDVLDADFMNWLREFSSWCRSAGINLFSKEDVVSALRRYSDHMAAMNIRDRAFLKAATFRMLARHCQEDNERLITLISGVVIGGMA